MGMQRKSGAVISRQTAKNLGKNDFAHSSSNATRAILSQCNDAEGVRDHLFQLGGHRVMILRGTKVDTTMNFTVEHVSPEQSDSSPIDINDQEDIGNWIKANERQQARPTTMIGLAWMNGMGISSYLQY